MSAAPEISVVMSVFNGESYLAETIESILGQAEVDLEFVIVDDGSTDSSPAILRDYAASDSRIRILSQENAGLTEALIRGCAEARGELIARQDVGDVSLPSRLRNQARMMRDCDDLAFVSCWTEFCGPEWEHLYATKGTGVAGRPTPVTPADPVMPLLDGPSCHPSVMFRKTSYQRSAGYRPQFYVGQDWDLWYRLAQTGKFQMIESVLYKARVFPESISTRSRTVQTEIGRLSARAAIRRAAGESDDDVLAQAKKLRSGPVSQRQRSRARAEGNYFIGEILRMNANPRSRYYLRQAVRENPLWVKAWLRFLQATIA